MRGGLHKKRITDKNGKQTYVWVKSSQAPKGEKIRRSKKNPDLVPISEHKRLLDEAIGRIGGKDRDDTQSAIEEARAIAADLKTLNAKEGAKYMAKIADAMKRDGVLGTSDGAGKIGESPEDDAWGTGGNQLEGLKHFVHVYDNGGDTFDRYTVVIDSQMFGASNDPFHPQGFGQFVGDVPDSWEKIKDFTHMGKRITDLKTLPEKVQKYIIQMANDEENTETTYDRAGRFKEIRDEFGAPPKGADLREQKGQVQVFYYGGNKSATDWAMKIKKKYPKGVVYTDTEKM